MAATGKILTRVGLVMCLRLGLCLLALSGAGVSVMVLLRGELEQSAVSCRVVNLRTPKVNFTLRRVCCRPRKVLRSALERNARGRSCRHAQKTLSGNILGEGIHLRQNCGVALSRGGRLCARGARLPSWTLPTLVDALAQVRQAWWKVPTFRISAPGREMIQGALEFIERLADVHCCAA